MFSIKVQAFNRFKHYTILAIFNPNIVIVGQHLDHFSSFKDNRFVQFHSVESNSSAVILTLKGLDELNLDEVKNNVKPLIDFTVSDPSSSPSTLQHKRWSDCN